MTTQKKLFSRSDRSNRSSLANSPRLLKGALLLQLALSGWGCSAQVQEDGDMSAQVQDTTQALDSAEATDPCGCGGEADCECNPGGGATWTGPVIVVTPPPANSGIANPADLLPGAGPGEAPVAGAGSDRGGGGLDGRLAHATEACRRRSLRNKNKSDAAVEATLADEITVIQTTYTTALASEEDFYQDQLNGCGNTVSCFLNVEAAHKSVAALLLSDRDASLVTARAAAAAAHQNVADDYKTAVDDCVV